MAIIRIPRAGSHSPSASPSRAPSASPAASPSASPSPAASPSASPSASPETPPLDPVSTAFVRLASAAAALNAASNEFGRPISAIEAALKTLNLGVSAWVKFAGEEDQASGEYSERCLGYARVNGRWGIAIRILEGNLADSHERTFEEWLFNDAPRAHRLEAADKLPELVEKLYDSAVDTTRQLKGKAEKVAQVAKAITQASATGAGARK